MTRRSRNWARYSLQSPARIACNIAGKKRDYLRDEVVST